MRPFVIITLILMIATTPGLAGAEGLPQLPPQEEPRSAHATPPEQQKMVEAYVPPPPIRHSWPGGYRVLLHELMNTLMDHMTGHY